MTTEPISQKLRRLLADHEGQHSRIAAETGVPQSTVSRIHRGAVSPRLSNAEALLAWFDKHKVGKSASRGNRPVGRRRINAGQTSAPSQAGQ